MISPEFGQFYGIFSSGIHASQLPTGTKASNQEFQLSFKIEEIKDPAKELFDQGLRIVGEYANLYATQMTDKGMAGDDIYFKTHVAHIIINGQERRFVVRAESHQSEWEDHKTPSRILPLSGPINIFIRKGENEGSDMLFNIRKQPDKNKFILHSPFRADNDPQAIRVASELLDAIEKYLSENHISLSKQSKPESKPKGILSIICNLASKSH